MEFEFFIQEERVKADGSIKKTSAQGIKPSCGELDVG